jgi:ankyrin repeat protein
MVARHLIDDDDSDNDYGIPDLKSFRQVNRALYACLNPIYWRELLAKHKSLTGPVLTAAIRPNNLARLKFFLEQVGVDIETKLGYYLDHGNISPLIEAVHLDNVLVSRYLLEKGAKVQDTSKCFSALRSARSAEMVQLLLEFNADPEMNDHDNRRPLHRYASRGNIEAMREVLQRGVEVDPLSRGRLRTPLHEATRHGVDAVSILLEFGADARRKDIQSNTPLHLAAEVGKTDAVRLLVERWPEGAREKNEELDTPLHLAVKMGKTDAVRLLVERWPEGAREKNKNLDTPLHLAAEVGETEVVRLLLEHWPEGVREKNKNLDTPLHLAGKVPYMADMLDLMAESWPEGLRMKNKDGRTPKPMWW